MAYRVRRAEYFYTMVRDEPGEAYKLLSQLAGLGINLVAFSAVPMGPLRTQLTLVPDDPAQLVSEAKKAGLPLDGPHPALLVQGDDQLGALATIHQKLFAANVNVYASSGVANGTGGFGYLIYVRPEKYDQALVALGVR
jgi:hypothetical protein